LTNNFIFVGCDSHDKTLVTRIAQNREKSERITFSASQAGRRKFIEELKRRSEQAGGAQIVVAYEASGNGFILSDELKKAGVECHVIAPSKIERSSKQKRNKNDDRDAERLLEILRGHYLGGNKLPSVWVPDLETRDDREIVAGRQDLSEKQSKIKTQVKTLLKRHGLEKPEGMGSGWTKRYRLWLEGLSEDSRRGLGVRRRLKSLLRQLEFLEEEMESADEGMKELANKPRWKPIVDELIKEKGVALKAAMKYATDIGDFGRFRRGRQVGAYFGLTPSSAESGESDDRKGHITHQGPASSRKILCQAAWSRVRHDKQEREVYMRIVAKNPKKKKIALVASTRRLAVRLFHIGRQAQLKMQSVPTGSLE
jgi:transposase